MLIMGLVAAMSFGVTATRCDDHVFAADGTGALAAWSLPSLDLDRTLTRRLSAERITQLVCDNDLLWGFDGTRLFTWNDEQGRWSQRPTILPPKPCTRLAMLADDPVGLCGDSVHRFRDGRRWNAPPFTESQIEGIGFYDRAQAFAAHGNTVAIGTSYGEWGGHLWLLDFETGRWQRHYGAPVAHLAWTSTGWLVTRSLAHMMTTSSIELGGEKLPLEEPKSIREGVFLRAVTRNRDGELIGIESERLVRIASDGSLHELQTLPPLHTVSEPWAGGPAPGINLLEPLESGGYLIVPRFGDAIIAIDGRTVVLHPGGA